MLQQQMPLCFTKKILAYQSICGWRIAELGEWYGRGSCSGCNETSIGQGKGDWGYAKAILQAWVEKGITSVEAAQAEEVAFRRGQQTWKQNLRQDEVIPEWFREQKHKRKFRREQEKVEKQLIDRVVEQGEFEKLLTDYRREGEVSGVG